jgi:hypothetical protein
MEGENPHPASYRGCSHEKEEQNDLPRDPLEGRSSLSSPHHSRPRHIPDKLTEWERFQLFASEIISPKIQINSEEEADKADRNLTVSIASACRIVTSKITLSDIKKDIPALENLLKHKRRLRKV